MVFRLTAFILLNPPRQVTAAQTVIAGLRSKTKAWDQAEDVSIVVGRLQSELKQANAEKLEMMSMVQTFKTAVSHVTLALAALPPLNLDEITREIASFDRHLARSNSDASVYTHAAGKDARAQRPRGKGCH